MMVNSKKAGRGVNMRVQLVYRSSSINKKLQENGYICTCSNWQERFNSYTRGLEASSQWYICSFRNHVNCLFAKFLQKGIKEKHC